MNEIATYEGHFLAPDAKFAIVVSRFNSHIVENLLDGAVDTLVRHKIRKENLTIVRTPGAFEIPLVVKKLADQKKHDAIIALGAVIRGDTPHFQYVAGECVKGLGRLTLQYGIPVSFGVLTVDTLDQAIERAGTKAGNKGVEAALAALETVTLLHTLDN